MADNSWLPDLVGRNPTKYLAIAEALADAVAAGTLKPGDQLPTYRELAWQLGLNVSTVTQAYREAARRYLISGEIGRGTYVLADSREAALFGLKDLESSDTIDLSTNVPVVDLANQDLQTTLKALVARVGFSANQGYHLPALVKRTQVAAATWLAWRGLEVPPSRVVPCAGAQQALTTVLLALCRPNGIILVEEYASPGVKAAARQLGLQLHGVAIDEHGMIPKSLDYAARSTSARVAVLVPLLQNPTGAIMDQERRRAIAEVARRRALFIVEDDVYGCLTDHPPLSLDLPEQGIVVSSLSKTVGPGLRFGFIAGNAAPIDAIATEIHSTIWPVAPLLLEVACTWIEDGTAFRRTAWQRRELAARHRIARNILRGSKVAPAGLPAPHLWLSISGNPDDCAAVCRRSGVEVVSGAVFAVGRKKPEAIRTSIAAAASRQDLSIGLRRIRTVLERAAFWVQ
jgi:DNA-binding transcriptional MocR family regulator